MKNHKTKIIGLAVLTIVATLAFSFVSADDKDKVVILRTFESDGNFCKAIVTDNEKTIKTVELEPFRPKSAETNIIKITAILSELKSQGYKLTTSNNNSTLNMTTYVLEKN